jgi:L-alanine-DL-glutamate epimerase-like enolase superfamily enzyme
MAARARTETHPLSESIGHTARESGPPVRQLVVQAYRFPTDGPESDGTLEWDATTMVTVHAHAGDRDGFGYTYAPAAAGHLIEELLSPIVVGRSAFAVDACWTAMVQGVRNAGRPGLASMAIAAVDTALWDLKARLLDLPLVTLLGQVRDSVPVYGSGGFTSYPPDRLAEQLSTWSAQGFTKMKMKVGRDAGRDVERVQRAREAIGPDPELFVDANGAYTRKQALAQAHAFAACGVSWFEEPVSSDDVDGLRLIRDSGPAGMAIAAGEYGFDLFYFRRLLEAGAVDVLQADATRCAGISELLRVGALCDAWGLPLSAHTAPALHLHPCCALTRICHIEYFYDHARLESALLDGPPAPDRGRLRPDLSRPGLGLELKQTDARRYAM